MFWPLLLAHFIADYPLQTNRMVVIKKTWSGLFLHVGVHFVTLFLLVFVILGADFATTIPFILLLAAIHYGIDTLKNVLSKLRPKWIISTYVMDQFYHVVSIALIAFLLAQADGSQTPFAAYPTITLILAGLLATHVWFITERILVYRNADYQVVVNQTMWPRIVGRGVLFVVLLLGWIPLEGVLLPAGLTLSWPYGKNTYQKRIILTDIAVVLVVFIAFQLIS